MDADLWTQDEGAAKRYNLNWIKSEAKANLSGRDSGVIHQGSNSGFQAINLTYLAPYLATHVLLIGYDMQRTDGKAHWFGDHPGGLARTSGYDSFVQAFRTIDVPDLEIVNCSRKTALHFPRMNIEDALDALR